jgi:hypothetical protein
VSLQISFFQDRKLRFLAPASVGSHRYDTVRVQLGRMTLISGYTELWRVRSKPLDRADTVAEYTARFVESAGLGLCNTITSDTAIITTDLCGGPMRRALSFVAPTKLVIAPNPPNDYVNLDLQSGLPGVYWQSILMYLERGTRLDIGTKRRVLFYAIISMYLYKTTHMDIGGLLL